MPTTAILQTGFSHSEIVEKALRELEETKEFMINMVEHVSQWSPMIVRKDGFVSS